MEISNCCGANRYNETDLCSRCKEHADFQEPIDLREALSHEDIDSETKYYDNYITCLEDKTR